MRDELTGEGIEARDVRVTRHLHLRYAGGEMSLPVVLGDTEAMRRDFERLHQQRFGFISPEKDVHVSHAEVDAEGGGTDVEPVADFAAALRPGAPQTAGIYTKGRWHDARVLSRGDIGVGSDISGRF